MTKKQKQKLIRIIVASFLFCVLFILDKTIELSSVFEYPFNWLFPFALFLIVYLIIGYDVIYKAFRNIVNGQMFDENFLMCIATFGAFGLAIFTGVTGEEIEGFDEACAVLILYQIGELFQSWAVRKSRKSITQLMDIRPDFALKKDGSNIIKCSPEDVHIGEIIIVNPGDKIPLDGVVVKGGSFVNTQALTGESKPRSARVGESVMSGCINITSTIEVQVQKAYYESTVTKILALMETASSKKATAENFITKFARYYTPVVVALAVIIAILPSAITGNWSYWIYCALSFLVVSCPCAFVISIPLAFFMAIGKASKSGILIKGSNYIEKINKIKTFVFDKTGTLTKGIFEVKKVLPENKKAEILTLACIAEKGISHPIAQSIRSSIDESSINYGDYEVCNIAGEGVCATSGENTILCGNASLLMEHGVNVVPLPSDEGTMIYVAQNGEYKGSILISDEDKNETMYVIEKLKNENIKTVILSGDAEKITYKLANRLNIKNYKSSLLPQSKVDEVEKLLKAKNTGEALCYVGDGINDAPVLMMADVGMAMGGIGSDAAVEASDVVLMNDNLKGILRCKKISKKCMRIVFENIIFPIAIKLAILILSIVGFSNLWLAVFGDVGVTILAILNALRLSLYKVK